SPSPTAAASRRLSASCWPAATGTCSCASGSRLRSNSSASRRPPPSWRTPATRPSRKTRSTSAWCDPNRYDDPPFPIDRRASTLMPEVSLSNSKGRDAQVMAESVRSPVLVRWIDGQNRQATSMRLLKSTLEYDYEALLQRVGSPDEVAKA